MVCVCVHAGVRCSSATGVPGDPVSPSYPKAGVCVSNSTPHAVLRRTAPQTLGATARCANAQRDLQRTDLSLRRVGVRVVRHGCVVCSRNVPLSCASVWPNRRAAELIAAARADALLKRVQAHTIARAHAERKRRTSPTALVLRYGKKFATKAARALPTAAEVLNEWS